MQRAGTRQPPLGIRQGVGNAEGTATGNETPQALASQGSRGQRGQQPGRAIEPKDIHHGLVCLDGPNRQMTVGIGERYRRAQGADRRACSWPSADEESLRSHRPKELFLGIWSTAFHSFFLLTRMIRLRVGVARAVAAMLRAVAFVAPRLRTFGPASQRSLDVWQFVPSKALRWSLPSRLVD